MHWQNQVRLYEHLCEANEHFSDGQKTTMLQNAVQPVEMLASVKQTAELDPTKTGRVLTYDQYCSLLISAVVYDQSSNRRVREDPRVAQAASLMDVFDRDDCLFAYVSSKSNDYRQEYNDVTYDEYP